MLEPRRLGLMLHMQQCIARDRAYTVWQDDMDSVALT